MKISFKKKRSPLISWLVVVPLLILLVYLQIVDTPSNFTFKQEEVHDVAKRTSIYHSKAYRDLIGDTTSILAIDDNLRLYITQQYGVVQILYLYKNQLSKRQRLDRFYLHIHLKDSSILKNKYQEEYFLNFDFPYSEPVSIVDGNNTYFLFSKPLIHYKSGNNVLLKEISKIYTGRFTPGLGRSTQLGPLVIPDTLNSYSPHRKLIKTMNISLDELAFDKLQEKRIEAIGKGMLMSENDDFVKAVVSDQDGKSYQAKLRLKGDYLDHLEDVKKWSMRIIMDGDETFEGMRKFSIQHPRVRNYLWEWLYHKVIKDEGLIGLRYDFYDVNLNIHNSSDTSYDISVGLMALEESFDKLLIENNKRREGIILAFNEEFLWDIKQQQWHYKLNIPIKEIDKKDKYFESNSSIRVFNKNKVLSDKKLSQQLNTAKDLLYGLQIGKYKISEVFDIDKLSTFVAITNLFGSEHGLAWVNVRIYYNPITNKLEPISFDGNSGRPFKKVHDFPFTATDDEYQELLLHKLAKYSNTDFVNNIIYKYRTELEMLSAYLKERFNVDFYPELLINNSNFIKSTINPAITLSASLIEKKKDSLIVEVRNYSTQKIALKKLKHIDGKILNTGSFIDTLQALETKKVAIHLNPHFVNAFVSKKNKKGEFQFPKDLEKLRLNHEIPGVNYVRETEIFPFSNNEHIEQSVAEYKKMHRPNPEQFSFIEHSNDSLIITAGEYTFDHTLIVPKNKILVIRKGSRINLVNNASIISLAPVNMSGSAELPIKIFSSDSTGGGLFVTNAIGNSTLTHCHFHNLSAPNNNGWELSGAINFHESTVAISHSSFSYNRCEDYLNIIRSDFSLSESTFTDTYSDAFDGDFVNGTISASSFINSGNDGIDVSGSTISLSEITIENPADKAISGGEASSISGENIRISGGEIGLVSKDLSKMAIKNVKISDTRLGISSFQKKSEFGAARITIDSLQLINTETDYLIERGSELIVDNKAVQTVSDDVIDKMYGNEYGKSSK